MDIDFVRQLIATASRAPSADNSQPWIFRWNGAELTIEFAVRHNAQGAFNPGSHATLLSIGATFEYLDNALTASGVAAQWRSPVEPHLGKPYAAVTIRDAAAKLSPPARLLQRHTNRLPYRTDAISREIIEGIDQYREGGHRAAVVVEPHQKSGLIRLVRRSSEARFCNRQLHEWLMGTLRFTPADAARGDGLDLRTLGLPPGGRQLLRLISDWRRMAALNRLGAYKALAISETALLSAAPALLCLSGPSHTHGIIAAGRLMCRLWADLNAQGIALHPYYVVTDQINRLRDGTLAAGFEERIADVSNQVSQLLALQSSEMLHMIFRMGYPKAQPARSMRLPLEKLFCATPAAS